MVGCRRLLIFTSLLLGSCSAAPQYPFQFDDGILKDTLTGALKSAGVFFDLSSFHMTDVVVEPSKQSPNGFSTMKVDSEKIDSVVFQSACKIVRNLDDYSSFFSRSSTLLFTTRYSDDVASADATHRIRFFVDKYISAVSFHFGHLNQENDFEVDHSFSYLLDTGLPFYDSMSRLIHDRGKDFQMGTLLGKPIDPLPDRWEQTDVNLTTLIPAIDTLEIDSANCVLEYKTSTLTDYQGLFFDSRNDFMQPSHMGDPSGFIKLVKEKRLTLLGKDSGSFESKIDPEKAIDGSFVVWDKQDSKRVLLTIHFVLDEQAISVKWNNGSFLESGLLEGDARFYESLLKGTLMAL